MKKILLLFLGVMFCLGSAEAKYVAPVKNKVKSRSDKIAAYQMKQYDQDEDGQLSLDEYQERFRHLTREDERNIRRNQKKGVYMSPEEQFQAMDTNNDNFVSEAERAIYIRSQRDSRDFLY